MNQEHRDGGVKVRAQGVSKLYRRMAPGFRLRTLKSALLERSLVGGLSAEESIPAVQDVSFEVAAGEAFGLIGSNGSGKSTLLKLLAGILQPTTGSVVVDGRVAALIELGAGFHPEISGRENIFINGSVLGLTRRQIEERYDDIIEFSGLEDFIEEPVKNYSSGMYVRLGFAVAVHTDPDVLMVDEVLSVGDEAFAHRCLHRIEELLSRGKTLLFVSHSLSLVEDLCDRVLWMDHGRPRLIGEPRRVVDAYREAVAEAEGRHHQRQKEESVAEGDSSPEAPRRWGSGSAKISSARLLVGDGAEASERYHLTSGEPASFEFEIDAERPIEDFVFGIGIATPRGVEVWGTNTDLAGWRGQRLEGGACIQVRCPELLLAAGEYRVDLAVHARDGAPYDYRQGVFSFSVSAPRPQVGVYAPAHEWNFSSDVQWVERGDAQGDPEESGNPDLSGSPDESRDADRTDRETLGGSLMGAITNQSGEERDE